MTPASSDGETTSAATSTPRVIVAVGAVIMRHRWRRTRAVRYVIAPVLWAAGPVVAYLVTREVADDFVTLSPTGARIVYQFLPAGLAVWPLVFLVGLLRTRLDYARVGALLPQLAGPVAPGRVRDALAATLHDPRLELLYWSPITDGCVDLDGHPREPVASSGRTVAPIGGEGGPLAVMLVDEIVLQEPALLQAAGAMARLALENERLQAEVRSQLVELRSTTARLVEAGQDARQRIERDLHDGAQQRLLALSMTLGQARARAGDGAADPRLRGFLDHAAADLQQAITELRELARGIHPMLLTQEGPGVRADGAGRAGAAAGRDQRTIPTLPRHRRVHHVLLRLRGGDQRRPARRRVGRARPGHRHRRRDDRPRPRRRRRRRQPHHHRRVGPARHARPRSRARRTHDRDQSHRRRDRDRREAAVRVILAEDSVLLREGLARLLGDADIEVTHAVGDADALLAAVDTQPPDVVVTDIRMPPTFTDEGLTAALTIRARHPNVAVLVLSQYLEAAYAERLLRHSATGAGYLLKDRVNDVTTLCDAIIRVARGESVTDPEVIRTLVARPRLDNPLDRLTHREREVLALMAQGWSNQGIGDRLFLSAKTVEGHVGSIMTRLRIADSREENRRVLAVIRYLRS